MSAAPLLCTPRAPLPSIHPRLACSEDWDAGANLLLEWTRRGEQERPPPEPTGRGETSKVALRRIEQGVGNRRLPSLHAFRVTSWCPSARGTRNPENHLKIICDRQGPSPLEPRQGAMRPHPRSATLAASASQPLPEQMFSPLAEIYFFKWRSIITIVAYGFIVVTKQGRDKTENYSAEANEVCPAGRCQGAQERGSARSTNCEILSAVPTTSTTALQLRDPGGPVELALPRGPQRPKCGAPTTSKNDFQHPTNQSKGGSVSVVMFYAEINNNRL
ncbi:hypothetical protein mRhiFer1_009758 [Rhinolophus ferrumequinum]|uniref:Uncharacterized protein n=1 Tax=Rhinolophus ferrumequinum TaxID=59479 RepID=A0A7J7ZD49_RHIFE|nr:hypothetical protein mRhiFer1_009758 [Rhinolophus ferrumequinum]